MNSLKNAFILILCALFSFYLYANENETEEQPQKKVKNESELSFIQIGGNSNVENYNVSTKTQLTEDKFIYTLGGSYFLSLYESTDEDGDTVDVESARNWIASLKLERDLNKRVNIFTQVLMEGDKFSGFTQRDNYDLGAKYKIIQTDKNQFFFELGYRYSVERLVEKNDDNESILYANKARLFIEYNKDRSKSLSYKTWIEYLANC